MVRSDDIDFLALVETHGGRITTPFSSTKIWPFPHLNKFCLDLHPEIDGYMKSLSAVRRGVASNEANSRDGFTDMYHICWSVMESTSVVSTGGDVLKGPDGILSNRDILPVGVELVQDPTQMCVMMMLSGNQYFRAEIYKVVTF